MFYSCPTAAPSLRPRTAPPLRRVRQDHRRGVEEHERPPKEPYEKQAIKDKRRYQKAMKTYVPPPQPKGRKKRAKKDPNAPKRACSAYMFYMQERRPQLVKRHPDWPFGQFGKVIARNGGA